MKHQTNPNPLTTLPLLVGADEAFKLIQRFCIYYRQDIDKETGFRKCSSNCPLRSRCFESDYFPLIQIMQEYRTALAEAIAAKHREINSLFEQKRG